MQPSPPCSPEDVSNERPKSSGPVDIRVTHNRIRISGIFLEQQADADHLKETHEKSLPETV